ncbi:MAG: hypothetical protein HQL13_02760 [Candidatus Omnitrophica bacterium]|nr:hypothetical protein [Candidatus Omnitrophota bacterium]
MRKFVLLIFIFLLLMGIDSSFAWDRDWDYRGSGRDMPLSEKADDYYSLGYVPENRPVDGPVNLTVAASSNRPLSPPAPLNAPAANPNEFTVTFPDDHGGMISVVIKKSGDGFIGPKGEYYPEFPKAWQLKMKYG